MVEAISRSLRSDGLALCACRTAVNRHQIGKACSDSQTGVKDDDDGGDDNDDDIFIIHLVLAKKDLSAEEVRFFGLVVSSLNPFGGGGGVVPRPGNGCKD